MTKDEVFMLQAMAQAELARGRTGDNPWVGCVIARGEELLGQGFTLGPGEHHAEISAAADAAARGHDITGATLYSTLEPCSFHGRTPACADAIVKRGLSRVVVAMRDPNPRVDGLGLRILREGGLEISEGVCETRVRLQLGPWILAQHPHEIARYAATLSAAWAREARLAALMDRYGLPESALAAFLG